MYMLSAVAAFLVFVLVLMGIDKINEKKHKKNLLK